MLQGALSRLFTHTIPHEKSRKLRALLQQSVSFVSTLTFVINIPPSDRNLFNLSFQTPLVTASHRASPTTRHHSSLATLPALAPCPPPNRACGSTAPRYKGSGATARIGTFYCLMYLAIECKQCVVGCGRGFEGRASLGKLELLC